MRHCTIPHHNLDIATAMLTTPAASRPSCLTPIHRLSEYHYRQLELAAAEGNAADAASRPVDHRPCGGVALRTIRSGHRRQCPRSPNPDGGASDRETLNRQAYAVYRRLVDLLGGSQQQLAASKNAQVSASRLAHYAQQTGQPAEAAALLDQLLKIRHGTDGTCNVPRRHMQQAGQYAQALPHWRALLAGLPAGSEQWYEAKYHQLEALASTDKEQARKVYRQFKLLHPELGGAAWQAKFTELTRNW